MTAAYNYKKTNFSNPIDFSSIKNALNKEQWIPPNVFFDKSLRPTDFTCDGMYFFKILKINN